MVRLHPLVLSALAMVLSAPLALAAPTDGSASVADVEADAHVDDVVTDDDHPLCPLPGPSLAEVCPALAGDDGVREANASWREKTVRSIDAGADSWEIVVRGATTPSEPRPGSFAGVTVRHLVLAPEDESCERLAWVAVVELDGTLAAACHNDQALLRADDAFGREGRVVAVGKEGVLVEHRGSLFFLAPDDEAVIPEFDVVWQSGFRIVDVPTTKKAARAKPKPRRGRRRR